MGGKVIVMGGGAAGAWCALAARSKGAEVALVRQAPGATAVSSGCFDFAAGQDLDGQPLSPITGAKQLARRRGTHPFARLGDSLTSAICDAMQFLIEQHGGLDVRGSTQPDANLRLVTPFGTVKETALAQGPIAAGDLATLPAGTRIGVASVVNRASFDAELVAAGLRKLGFDGVVLPVVYEGDAHSSLAELASKLEVPALRDAFVARATAAAKQAGVQLLLLPTAGLSEPVQTIAAFQEIKAAELVAVPPSVPGLRFDNDLEHRLIAAGVQRVNAPVVAGVIEDETVQRVVLDDGREMSADAFVLATGRFIGGGIQHDGSFRETVFGLPVFVDGRDPGEQWVGSLLSRNAAEDQPGLRAGVMVDATMRPTDELGQVMAGNLFAAGSVIGGFDPARDRSGLGVVAVTALVAGRNAARVACHPLRAESLESGGSRS